MKGRCIMPGVGFEVNGCRRQHVTAVDDLKFWSSTTTIFLIGLPFEALLRFTLPPLGDTQRLWIQDASSGHPVLTRMDGEGFG